jgi:hypothetical protein
LIYYYDCNKVNNEKANSLVIITYSFVRKEILLWHTLLVILASAAVHVLLSALFQLFLRELLSTRSILTHVSTAVLAQLSALFQLFLRVDNLENLSLGVSPRLFSF